MEIVRKNEEKNQFFFNNLMYGDIFYYVKDKTRLFLKGYDEDDCDCQIDLDDGSVESPNLAERVILVKGKFIEEE